MWPDDVDFFLDNWNEMLDPEKASARAIQLMEAVLRGEIDPVKEFRLLEAAIEPAWDGPKGDVPLAHEALLKAEIAVYDAERKLPLGTAEQILLRSRFQTLMARSWHRMRNFKQATLLAFAVIKSLEELVGRRQLLEIVGRPTHSAIAEAAVEALGVYIAAFRRTETDTKYGFKKKTAKELYDLAFDLLLAYLGPDLEPKVIYPGTDAVAAQWFYRLVNDPNAADELVEALYRLDIRTRPDQKRSLVTAHARDAEYAARRGELELAKREAGLFVGALELLGMVRHLTTIREQGYFGT